MNGPPTTFQSKYRLIRVQLHAPELVCLGQDWTIARAEDARLIETDMIQLFRDKLGYPLRFNSSCH